jgi:hypothetical protein
MDVGTYKTSKGELKMEIRKQIGFPIIETTEVFMLEDSIEQLD